jgi:uncharacterized membrane protein
MDERDEQQLQPGENVDQRESRLRSLLKAVSYRIIGTVTTATLTFVVTGSMRAALTMGFIEPVVKMLIYYLHERAWQLVPRGTIRHLFHN